MATRPDKLPRWADIDTPNGPLGQSNVGEPDEAKKDIGWNWTEKPPREWQNWLQLKTYEWLDYLVDLQDASGGLGNNFANDLDTTSGLTFGVRAGHMLRQTGLIPVAAGTVTLTDNQINQVYLDFADNLVHASVGTPPSQESMPLYEVNVAAGVIVTTTDLRTFATATNELFYQNNGSTSWARLGTDNSLDITLASVSRFNVNTARAHFSVFTGFGTTSPDEMVDVRGSNLLVASTNSLATLQGNANLRFRRNNIFHDVSMNTNDSGTTLDLTFKTPSARNMILGNSGTLALTTDNVAADNLLLLRKDVTVDPTDSTTWDIAPSMLIQNGQTTHADKDIIGAIGFNKLGNFAQGGMRSGIFGTFAGSGTTTSPGAGFGIRTCEAGALDSSVRAFWNDNGYLGLLGVNEDPNQQVHLHEDISATVAMLFTNTVSGTSAGAGFRVGIDGSGAGEINHLQNTDILTKVAGGQVSSINREQLVVSKVDSGTSHGLQVNRTDSGSSYAQFVNSTTGSASTAGMIVGINSAEKAVVLQQGNLQLALGTNNIERILIDNGSTLADTKVAIGSGIKSLGANISTLALGGHAANTTGGVLLTSNDDSHQASFYGVGGVFNAGSATDHTFNLIQNNTTAIGITSSAINFAKALNLSAGGLVSSPDSIILNVDSDNSSTGESFIVGRNTSGSPSAANRLIELFEDGTAIYGNSTINGDHTFYGDIDITSDISDYSVVIDNSNGIGSGLSVSTAATSAAVKILEVNSAGDSQAFNVFADGKSVFGSSTPSASKFTLAGATRIQTSLSDGQEERFVFEPGGAGDAAIFTMMNQNETAGLQLKAVGDSYIATSGNFGVGVSTVNQKLHVGGEANPTIRLEALSGVYNDITTTTAGGLRLGIDQGNTGATTDLQISMNGSDVLNLASNGLFQWATGFNAILSTTEFMDLSIDSDDNSTGQAFRWWKDGQGPISGTKIMELTEGSTLKLSGTVNDNAIMATEIASGSQAAYFEAKNDTGKAFRMVSRGSSAGGSIAGLSGNGLMNLDSDASNLAISADSSIISLGSNSTSAMMIDTSNGNIGVGVTSVSAGYRFQVDGGNTSLNRGNSGGEMLELRALNATFASFSTSQNQLKAGMTLADDLSVGPRMFNAKQASFGGATGHFMDTAPVAAGRGTGIEFGGISNDTGAVETVFGRILATKSNNTQGNIEANLSTWVSGGGGLFEATRINSAGQLIVSPGASADANMSIIGPGTLALHRDDTAAVDQITFFKNGSNAASIGTDVNQMSFGVNNANKMTLTTTALQLASGVSFLHGDGTAGAPGVAFASNPNLGLFVVGANNMGISAGGVERVSVNTSRISTSLPITGTTGSASFPSYSFGGNNNTGMHDRGLVGNASSVGFSINGGDVGAFYSNNTFSTRGLALGNDIPDALASTTGAVLKLHSSSSNIGGADIVNSNVTYSAGSMLRIKHADATPSTSTNFISCEGTAGALFRVDQTGKVYSDASTSISTPADYAEMFEWKDGNPDDEDRVGLTVALEDGMLVEAKSESDAIIGIVSGNPAVLADSGEMHWKGMYLTDEFNRRILQEGTDRPVLNPDYDPETPYIPRTERKEWSPVGLMGKLTIKPGQVIKSGWIKLKDIGDAGLALYLVR